MIKPKYKMDPFPIRHVLKGYNLGSLRSDFFAGLNVALLDFPQSMAYALLIGFPVAYGIYAAAIASVIGPLFGSSRYLILGPTNATSVLVLSSFLTFGFHEEERGPALVLLLLMVGVFMVIGSFLKLAGLIKYISRSVITGYITAAALLIIGNQMATTLGLPVIQATTFFETLFHNFSRWHQVQWQAVIIAIITVAIYVIIKKQFKKLPTVAITLTSVILITYGLRFFDFQVELLSAIHFNEWSLKWPTFNFEMINQLGSAALAIAFLSILESSSIAKSIAARAGERVDVNQQILSMGITNIISALGSGLAISGSLTRSMLNWSSGAKTCVSSIISGCFLILGIFIFGPWIKFLPKPALSAIVIIVGVSLINWENIKIVSRSTKSDATVFFTTFIGGLLFPLDIAIYVGSAASIILFLKKVSEPMLVEYAFNDRGELAEKEDQESENMPEISIIHIEGELFFGSVDIFLDQTRFIFESPNLKVIILRVRNTHHLDATSAMAIADLIRFAREKHIGFIVSGANQQVEHVFYEAGVMELLGEDNFFRHIPINPNLSTRNALKRAQQIIGKEVANIVLFAAPHDEDDDGKARKLEQGKGKKRLA